MESPKILSRREQMAKIIDETLRTDVIGVFEHFKGIGMMASDVFKVLENQGTNPKYCDVNHLCQLLVKEGTIVKNGQCYGISTKPDGSLYCIGRAIKSRSPLSPPRLCKQIDELMSIKYRYRMRRSPFKRILRLDHPPPAPLPPSRILASPPLPPLAEKFPIPIKVSVII